MHKFGIDIFADGANSQEIIECNKFSWIRGFTTNPTLMRKAGVKNYETFAKTVLRNIKDKPVSFEVFANDVKGMERQARIISSWGPNAVVKIPVTNTRGIFTGELIYKLLKSRIPVNITAVMTRKQVSNCVESVPVCGTPCYISIFAGRIADTGRDPIPTFTYGKNLIVASGVNIKLIWASVREIINIEHAASTGCDIITVPGYFLKRMAVMLNKDLAEYSLETVKEFYADALSSKFTLKKPKGKVYLYGKV